MRSRGYALATRAKTGWFRTLILASFREVKCFEKWRKGEWKGKEAVLFQPIPTLLWSELAARETWSAPPCSQLSRPVLTSESPSFGHSLHLWPSHSCSCAHPNCARTYHALSYPPLSAQGVRLPCPPLTSQPCLVNSYCILPVSALVVLPLDYPPRSHHYPGIGTIVYIRNWKIFSENPAGNYFRLLCSATEAWKPSQMSKSISVKLYWPK